MSQLKYDIAEFIINNKDEIKEFLKKETSHFTESRVIFEAYPEMYNDGLKLLTQSVLAHHLSNHFPCCFESICLILDDQFVKITLDL